MTPLKAIRAKCLDCVCGQLQEVRLCPCKDCPLYPFRMGKNPNRAGVTNNGSFSKNNGTASDYSPETAEEG